MDDKAEVTMEYPMISVVVLFYNSEAYAVRTLDALVSQTYKNLEILCVDDGSTDRTGAIIDQYAEKYENVKALHKENGGSSSTRNYGIQHAKGEYVGFLDGDDAVENDIYEILYSLLSKHHTDIALVNADYMTEDGKSHGPVFDFEEGIISNERQLDLLLQHKGCSAVWNCLFKREFLEKNLFDESKGNEDFLFWIRIIPQFDTIYFKNVIRYHYYLHEGSISRSGFSKDIIDMVNNTWEAKELVERSYPQLSEVMDRFFMYQRLIYLEFIPLDLMRAEDNHYMSVMNDLKQYESKIDSNRYLTRRQKFLLHQFIHHPERSRRYIGLRESLRKLIKRY